MGRVTNYDGWAGWCNKFTLLCINKMVTKGQSDNTASRTLLLYRKCTPCFSCFCCSGP